MTQTCVQVTLQEFAYFSLGLKKLDHDMFVLAWFDIADIWYGLKRVVWYFEEGGVVP